MTRPGDGIGGNMHDKGLPGGIFLIGGVMGSEGPLFGCAVGRLRRIDHFRRHRRGIDDFTLFSGAARHDDAVEKQQETRKTFHDRPSSPEVFASVSTRLTGSTRTTACG